MIKILFLLVLSLLALLQTACTSMTPTASKRAYCNMLKSDLVFNGSTSVTREANIENSQTPLVQQTYDQEDCSD